MKFWRKAARREDSRHPPMGTIQEKEFFFYGIKAGMLLKIKGARVGWSPEAPEKLTCCVEFPISY